jgi:hypothetical protein
MVPSHMVDATKGMLDHAEIVDKKVAYDWAISSIEWNHFIDALIGNGPNQLQRARLERDEARQAAIEAMAELAVVKSELAAAQARIAELEAGQVATAESCHDESENGCFAKIWVSSDEEADDAADTEGALPKQGAESEIPEAPSAGSNDSKIIWCKQSEWRHGDWRCEECAEHNFRWRWWCRWCLEPKA